jgi:transposase InsO family protein
MYHQIELTNTISDRLYGRDFQKSKQQEKLTEDTHIYYGIIKNIQEASEPVLVYPEEEVIYEVNASEAIEDNMLVNLFKELDNESEEVDYYYFTGEKEPVCEEGDILIFPCGETDNEEFPQVLTAYKRVDKKIHPVPGTFPEAARVTRKFPHDPLLTLPSLPVKPPDFKPTERLSVERLPILKINDEEFLWPEEERLFIHVMSLNQEAIGFEDSERGTLKESYFSPYIIPTIPHVPWAFRNIPIPPGIQDKVMEVLKKKIEGNVYEPSQSSYRSRWFCILKKDGKLRIVHDLQPLNAITIRDAGLPPILDEFVEPFAGRQCYTVFDLLWGFDARKVHPSSRDLTAFMSPLGLLRLTSLPMGFTNSPAEFQRCMTFILQDEIPKVANIFIDDLPIKGPQSLYLQEDGTPEVLSQNPGIRRFIWEHAQDVHRILHRLHCAGVTISAKKTQLCRQNVVIVGQKCTPEGRCPEDNKVDKVLNWPPLKTPKDVRGFLGLCGTVRIWIENYSALARPLTELIHKGAEFVWDDRRQEAFETLKEKVASAPALRPIDYSSDNPTFLSVDSSNVAAGFILSQMDEDGRRRPARYGSLPMNEREARYSQPKLELYGLYRALRHWRIFLVGIKNLHIEVDAKYIKGMLNEPDLQPNAAINRWIQGILLFDFKLIHVPATQFKGPDALSRRELAEGEEIQEHDDSWLDDIALLVHIPDPHQLKDFSFTTPTKLPYKVYTLHSVNNNISRQDIILLQVKQFLSTLEIPTTESLQARKRFLKKSAEFYLKDNRMFRRNGIKMPLLVVMDSKKRIAILTQAHENLGHKGEQAVFDLVRLRFFWPHLRSDIHHHVSSCHQCQIRSLKKIEVPPTISTPTALFQKVYIDVMFMPPSAGFHFIVAARDDLSGVTEVRALRSNNSQSLAKFFWEQIYCRYGAIEHVVTDNGGEVKGAFESLLRRMEIPQVRISPYNKHANGAVERGHFTLREAIVKSSEKDKFGRIKNWHKQIDLASFADRITVSSVTGYSPYYLLHGTHPLLPFDLAEATFMIEGFQSDLSTSDLLALRIRQLERHQEDIDRAAEVLKQARFKSKLQFEQRFRRRLQKRNYEPGELVLVRNSRLEMTIAKFKTDPRYIGPYEVVRRTKRGTYVLRELDGAEHAEHYAAFRILPYIYRSDPVIYELMNDEDEDESIEDHPVSHLIPLQPNNPTDIILAIKPEFAAHIVSRNKNHEFRKYLIPSTVCRMWLYETSPISAIQYVISTGPVKRPGEVNDPSGLGNEDFDAGNKQSKFGYPIHHLYKLSTPISAKRITHDYNINIPHRYCFVPPLWLQDFPLSSLILIF